MTLGMTNEVSCSLFWSIYFILYVQVDNDVIVVGSWGQCVEYEVCMI